MRVCISLNFVHKMSLTPGRTSSYSTDLRWRIVWQRLALGLAVKDVASNLGIDASTVSRICSLFKTTGSVEKRPYPKNARPLQKLTKAVQLTVLHTVLQNPSIYLRELQIEVLANTGVEVGQSSLCTFLKQSNFTRQKMQIVAKQRDEDLRLQFATDVSLYSVEMLVFLDETGSDQRDALRRYGYSLRGKPPRSVRLLHRGEHISAITAMTSEGIQCVRVEVQLMAASSLTLSKGIYYQF